MVESADTPPDPNPEVAALEAAASRVWPWFVADAAFRGHLDALTQRCDPATLHPADLALLHAYRAGHPEAARVVALTYAPHLNTALIRAGATAADAEDLVQTRLLQLIVSGVAGDDSGFRGEGSLLAWLKRCLIRDLRDLQRSTVHSRSTELDLDALEILGIAPNAAVPNGPATVAAPYDAALFYRHAPEFCKALRTAVNALSPDDRTLFELHYRERLTAGQIGTMLGQHRVTVQRHISALQESLRLAVKRELEARFKLAPVAVSTLLRSLITRFDMTVVSVLSPTQADAAR